MALKFKKPFGSGSTPKITLGRKLRDSIERDRKRLRDFRKLQGKPRRKLGARV